MEKHCARSGFSGLLAALRTQAGLSQEVLAALAGVSVRALRDLETGRVAVPQQRSAEALARALGLSGEAREHFLQTVSSARRDRTRNRAGRTGRSGPDPAAVPTPAQGPGVGRAGMEPMLGRPGTEPMPRPAQVPPPLPSFTGRAAELPLLCALLEAGTPTAVTGPPGIGKTALALQVAHRVRDRFPDGQLYAHLGGSSARPDGDTGDAPGEGADRGQLPWPLVRLLRDLGPVTRRLLIVLDDVPDPDLVRPLLSCAPRCSLLLTSRQSFSRLPGCRQVPLEPMGLAESAELLGRIVGRRRTAAEPEATAALLELCAGSPRALRSGAQWLARRPGWSVTAAVRRVSRQQGDPVG